MLCSRAPQPAPGMGIPGIGQFGAHLRVGMGALGCLLAWRSELLQGVPAERATFLLWHWPE
eukprot:6971629-Pyramimonas_sp.AAC.1